MLWQKCHFLKTIWRVECCLWLGRSPRVHTHTYLQTLKVRVCHVEVCDGFAQLSASRSNKRYGLRAKRSFGISDTSKKKQQRRVSTAKDFAVVLSAASAGRPLQGDDFLHLLSGYVQANLADLRSGMLRLTLNTPCLSYLSSLVKKWMMTVL